MTSELRFGDHIQLLTGFPFRSGDYVQQGVRLLRGDNIAPGKLRWAAAKRLPEALAGEYGKYLLRAGDVVLAMDRPWIASGLKYAQIRDVDAPSLLVQRVARLRATGTLKQRFLPYLIGSPQFAAYVRGVQTGTGIPHISPSQIL
ncbi:hypothetical protein J7E99_35435, partial [Streptomyces sp. ISL-44]|uniref:hypothetical protein n=1 Tax=Streptomyces sp. ISL-44 TaxID=2819184 RepID=UPI001BE74C37